MSYLENFTETQREALIALPYKVGLWVGESDSSGGGEADAAERAALESIITGYAEDFLKSEFVEEIMRETLAHREDWERWAQELANIVEECERCCGYVSDRVNARELDHFKRNLMDIALTVAAAYREYDEKETSFSEKLSIFGRFTLLKCRSFFTKNTMPDLDAYLNISQDERKALQALSNVLDLDMVEEMQSA